MSLTKRDRIVQSISGTNVPPGPFAAAISHALRREYGTTHAAVKTVVGLTGANERAVKNWFEARNGPSGESLIALCRHSDEVLETFLLMADRQERVKAKKIIDATKRLRDLLRLLDELQTV
jgi:tRNA A37 threonylcarbamoyladenosine synthetase subunit TsaC/SUA5/YrdC